MTAETAKSSAQGGKPAQWFIRTSDSSAYGANSLDQLRAWAESGRITPESEASCNGKDWVAAHTVPELKMDWLVESKSGVTNGPLNILAIPDLLRRGIIEGNAILRNKLTAREVPVASIVRSAVPSGEKKVPLPPLRPIPPLKVEAGPAEPTTDFPVTATEVRQVVVSARVGGEMPVDSAGEHFRAEIAGLRRDLDSRTRALEGHRKAAEEQRRVADRLSRELAEERARLEQTRSDLQTVVQERDSALQLSGDTEARLQRLLQEKSEAARAPDPKQASIEAHRAEILTLQQEIDSMQKNLDTAHERLRVQKSESLTQLHDVQEQFQNAVRDRDAALETVAALEADLENTRRERQEVATAEQTSRTSMEETQQRITALETELDSARSALLARDQELDVARQTLKDREGDLALQIEALKKDNDRISAREQELLSRIAATGEQQTAAMEALRAEKDLADAAAHQRERELSTAQKAAADAEARAKEIEIRCTALQADLADRAGVLAREQASRAARERELQRQIEELQARAAAVAPPEPAQPPWPAPPEDKAVWHLRLPGEPSMGPITLTEMRAWASECRIGPDHQVSSNGQDWTPAPDLAELAMRWHVRLVDGTLYGPLSILAVRYLIEDGAVAADAEVTHRITGAKEKALDALLAECTGIWTDSLRHQTEAHTLVARIHAAEAKIRDMEQQLRQRAAIAPPAAVPPRQLHDQFRTRPVSSQDRSV